MVVKKNNFKKQNLVFGQKGMMEVGEYGYTFMWLFNYIVNKFKTNATITV